MESGSSRGWSVSVFSLLALFGMLARSLPSVAAAAIPAGRYVVERPGPPNEATLVEIGVYLVNLSNFNEQDQTFSGDFILSMAWTDARLRDPSSKAARVFPLSDIWTPRLVAVNRRGAEYLFPQTAEVNPEGRATAIQRISGSLSVNVDLHDFPFDSQTFSIELVTRGYSASDVKLVQWLSRSGKESSFTLSGWKIRDISMKPFEKSLVSLEPGQALSYSGFRIDLTASRDRRYYIMREILPLLFVVLMASALFWIPTSEHGMKVGISTAAIFSLMAYYVQLGRSMPRLDYLTRMDYFLIGSTILVFVSYLQVIIGMYWAKSEKLARAVRMEKWSRAAYPVFLVLVFWFSFIR